MGVWAVNLFASQIVNCEIPEKKIQLDTEFLLRRTAGPVRVKRKDNTATYTGKRTKITAITGKQSKPSITKEKESV